MKSVVALSLVQVNLSCSCQTFKIPDNLSEIRLLKSVFCLQENESRLQVTLNVSQTFFFLTPAPWKLEYRNNIWHFWALPLTCGTDKQLRLFEIPASKSMFICWGVNYVKQHHPPAHMGCLQTDVDQPYHRRSRDTGPGGGFVWGGTQRPLSRPCSTSSAGGKQTLPPAVMEVR